MLLEFDLVNVKNLVGIQQHWLNATCWGTSFPQVKIWLGDNQRSAEHVWNTFVDTWSPLFGMPEVIVCDPGLEFKGYFAEQCCAYATTLIPTDARSPWQNRRTEKA
eukprot:2482759-Karenia_brevis.AAC.1